MISEQYDRATSLLREHQDGHAALSKILLEREIIYAEDLENIFGKRPWKSRSEEILNNNEELPKTPVLGPWLPTIPTNPYENEKE